MYKYFCCFSCMNDGTLRNAANSNGNPKAKETDEKAKENKISNEDLLKINSTRRQSKNSNQSLGFLDQILMEKSASNSVENVPNNSDLTPKTDEKGIETNAIRRSLKSNVPNSQRNWKRTVNLVSTIQYMKQEQRLKPQRVNDTDDDECPNNQDAHKTGRRDSSATTQSPSLGRLYLKMTFNESIKMLQIMFIQSHQVLTKEQQSLFKKIQFHLAIIGERRMKYHSTIKDYSDYVYFNEQFFYSPINKENLQDIQLRVRLYGKEVFGSDKLLSEDSYNFVNFDMKSKTNYITLNLKLPVKIPQNFKKQSNLDKTGILMDEDCYDENPQLHIGLNYKTKTNNLVVYIFEGHNLWDPCMNADSKKIGNPPDTYVDVVLKEEKNTVSSHRTQTIKCESNPIYKEIFEFNVKTNQLSSTKVLVYVYSIRATGQKCLIGCIELEQASSISGIVSHWNTATVAEDDMVFKWHDLTLSKAMKCLNQRNHKI